MNRIILIGNGFDLAHNLNTKYEHFIENFWRKTIDSLKKGYGVVDNEFITISTYFSTRLKKKIHPYVTEFPYEEIGKRIINIEGTTDDFEKEIKKIISNVLSLQYWLDIETKEEEKREEYYKNISKKNATIEHNQYYKNSDDYRIIKDNELGFAVEYRKNYKCVASLVSINFKNKFLKIISENLSLKNWIDIEEEYYKLLQGIINKKNQKTYTNIKQLNKDFACIKKELENYLIEKTTKGNEFNKTINENIYSEFKFEDFTKEGEKEIKNEAIQKAINYSKMNKKSYNYDLLDERTYLLLKDIIDSHTFSEKFINIWENDIRLKLWNNDKFYMYFHLVPFNLMFLNFNYSNTEKLYIEQKYEVPAKYGDDLIELKIYRNTIHIHGELENSENPIIFGYGDEIGKEYEEIENLNDNDFLENIKSIRYSDTNNYKRLLDYINSDKYQIYLFGHSCGLSDRTLLNTLFEHKNCVSIKPFYYYDEKKGTDNYSDIVRNISRHFKDKAVMREKVVNKEYCKPLS